MSKRILLIDNDDSFTMNINQLIEELGYSAEILNYSELRGVVVKNFEKIIISPGPGHPKEYTKYTEILDGFVATKSFLGICLGMQILGQYFGAKLKRCDSIEHGKQSRNIIISHSMLFKDVPQGATIGRYHSWTLDKSDFPNELIINSISEDGEIMSFSHKILDVCGVQFHPESYITEYGDIILKNWIEN